MAGKCTVEIGCNGLVRGWGDWMIYVMAWQGRWWWWWQALWICRRCAPIVFGAVPRSVFWALRHFRQSLKEKNWFTFRWEGKKSLSCSTSLRNKVELYKLPWCNRTSSNLRYYLIVIVAINSVAALCKRINLYLIVQLISIMEFILCSVLLPLIKHRLNGWRSLIGILFIY